MGSEKMPSVWVVLDNETGKMLTTGSTKQEVCEWLSHSGYASQVVDDHPGFEIVEYVPREDRSITELPKEPRQYYTSNPGLYYCAGCRQTIPLGHPCGCHPPPSEARIREIVREEIGKVRIKQTEPRAVGDVWKWRYDLKLIPQGEK